MDYNNDRHHGPSHERWLISYADFITLLFAVFVVLFTSASMGKDRARQVSDAISEALKSGLVGVISGKHANGAKAGTGQGNLFSSVKDLSQKFKTEIEKGQISVRLEPRGLIISMKQAAFFPSGQSEIDPATYPIVEKIASVIMKVSNPVHLEGHTDDVPISNSRYRSNWELSAGRSIAMLEVLTTRHGVPRSRLSIAGFADTMPLDSNSEAEGRAHNRRVDVAILNEFAAEKVIPAPEKAPR